MSKKCEHWAVILLGVTVFMLLAGIFILAYCQEELLNSGVLAAGKCYAYLVIAVPCIP